jgi:hypothetical protein
MYMVVGCLVGPLYPSLLLSWPGVTRRKIFYFYPRIEITILYFYTVVLYIRTIFIFLCIVIAINSVFWLLQLIVPWH